MFQQVKLSPAQWRRLASAASQISVAIILFSLAALFVPETVGLSKEFSRLVAVLYLFGGLIILTGSVMLSKKE